jgi:putative transposase
MSIRCHKIRLDPNATQEKFFRQCVGTARFVYNHALARWKDQYDAGLKPSEAALRREFNAIKREQYPWMMETPKAVAQQAIKNLGSAYTNFFRRVKQRTPGKKGFPAFKRKHSDCHSARLDNGPGTFAIQGTHVKLPVIGSVKTFETLRWPEGRLLSATLRLEAGRWFLSVAVEISQQEVGENQTLPSVGIDLGLTTALVLSNGERFSAPNPLRASLKCLANLQRSVHRKVKGSANRAKAKQKVARCHWRIAQIRQDWQHKTTSSIASRFGLVCLEDLNVKGMVQNRCLARSISDIGWSEIGRQLSYKTQVVEVGRFFASSKTCSCCGEKKADLPLNVRSWNCEKCGAAHDRDINASINIKIEGERISAASCAVVVCGESSSGHIREDVTKLGSAKQKSRTYHLILK